MTREEKRKILEAFVLLYDGNQTEVGEALGVGQFTISRWLQNKREIKSNTIIFLIRCLTNKYATQNK